MYFWKILWKCVSRWKNSYDSLFQVGTFPFPHPLCSFTLGFLPADLSFGTRGSWARVSLMLVWTGFESSGCLPFLISFFSEDRISVPKSCGLISSCPRRDLCPCESGKENQVCVEGNCVCMNSPWYEGQGQYDRNKALENGTVTLRNCLAEGKLFSAVPGTSKLLLSFQKPNWVSVPCLPCTELVFLALLLLHLLSGLFATRKWSPLSCQTRVFRLSNSYSEL